MTAPQVIMIALMAVGAGSDLVRDGQPKTGKHSFALTLFSTILTTALLWWGGFWK